MSGTRGNQQAKDSKAMGPVSAAAIKLYGSAHYLNPFEQMRRQKQNDQNILNEQNKKIRQLEKDNRRLENNYTILEIAHDSLFEEHQALKSECEKLKDRIRELERKKEDALPPPPKLINEQVNPHSFLAHRPSMLPKPMAISKSHLAP